MYHTVQLSVLNSCRRARGAGYQHGNRRGCLRGTREAVLNDIESWTKDFSESPVFWLNGLAGTGKSTIAQTVAERVFADGVLGASFFCSRDFEDRSDLHFIFPTLAFQLAHKYPDFRDHLVSLLQSNPDVVDESLYNQMERLIVEPLQSTDISTVIVVDALDECKDEEPSSAILSVLGRFVEQIPRVKFFITGRPEPRIKSGFRLPLLVDSTNVFVLHDVHPSLINNDIRLFLKHELSELARRCRLDGWPCGNDLDVLCRRAAGLFVYAVATVKFIDSSVHLPERRLDMIINLPECTDLEGKTRLDQRTTLDSLYASILRTAFGEGDPEVDSKIRSTIGAVVLIVNPLPPSGIAELVGLATREVILFLTLVQSLLALDEDSSQPVKPFHKSFPDFITDPSRCVDARFYICPGNLHLELLTNCLKLMNGKLERNLLSLPDYALNSEVKDLEKRINDRITIALRYACQSWHNHLTETRGDVTDVVPHLRVFLEEKFLAWLEVVSVLGAARGAVTALERLAPWLQEVCFTHLQYCLILIHAMNQADRNEELLDTARDCFHFVTKFFEPINVSAVHIYHSALELSPLSSIVRRLYYHQRRSPFPRVVAGTPDAWDKSIHINDGNYCPSYTWSPCGQFIAVQVRHNVEIRDSLSSELLSTLARPNAYPNGQLAYSPDGHSLASLFDTSLTIWDIQTGGVAKEIENGLTNNLLLTWSLDGATICAIFHVTSWFQDRSLDGNYDYVLHMYDVASGTTLSSATLRSRGGPHLWAHGTSFRVITVERNDQALTIQTFEAGSIFTKVESSCIESCGPDDKIGSFSPATYRLSVANSVRNQVRILDIRKSECLLEEFGEDGKFVPSSEGSPPHCFSPDGNLFATPSLSSIHIWKYASGRYTPWRNLPVRTTFAFNLLSHQFSPTSSSILGCSNGPLQVWRLDGPPAAAHLDDRSPFAILSYRGTYIVTGRVGGNTVTITNLHSQTPPQYIDTNMTIGMLALTDNVLLVWGSGELVAWRLTEMGMVSGVFADRRAGRSDNIWIVSNPGPRFWVGGETVVIEGRGVGVHSYHMGTGELTQAPLDPRGRRYDPIEMQHCLHYPNYCNSDEQSIPPEDDWSGVNWPGNYLLDDSPRRYWPGDEWPGDAWQVTRAGRRATVEEGWVKDFKGKHRLWIPVEWRVDLSKAGWLCDTALLLNHRGVDIVVVL